MIAILEPTYALKDHAAINAAILHAFAEAFPDERMVFAAAPVQRAEISQVTPMPPGIAGTDLAVMEPGGVRLSRALVQWRAARAIVRAERPRFLVLLSSGPETFFAARALAAEFSDLEILIVLHGNLNDAVGWRSRDPRRRLFDYRAGLRTADHPKIRFVVLEQHIGDAAIELGLIRTSAMLVWPHPLPPGELHSGHALPASGPIKVAFVGAATRSKGFDRFLSLLADLRQAGVQNCQFSVIGCALESFPEATALGLVLPPTPLSREEFLVQLRAVDYVLLPMMERRYELTASGSLLDCIGQAKPVISLNFVGVREMARQFGEIGWVCRSMSEMRKLLADGRVIRDPAAYDRFRRNLVSASATRTPSSLRQVLLDQLRDQGWG